ncbi:MAG: nucleotidyltransferase domain-containing protein [Synergistaceae bacterium]|jgi:predicted nucleotidyltransferase|nr:nucleotidyltransferase domain-containing protein [Synergistaceae bacterium]
MKKGRETEHQIYTIGQITDKLTALFASESVKRAVLFGSYAKGEARNKSDIDLVVESELKGLAFVGLVGRIRDALDRDVDVLDVTHIEKGSKVALEVEKSGVIIYEK